MAENKSAAVNVMHAESYRLTHVPADSVKHAMHVSSSVERRSCRHLAPLYMPKRVKTYQTVKTTFCPLCHSMYIVSRAKHEKRSCRPERAPAGVRHAALSIHAAPQDILTDVDGWPSAAAYTNQILCNEEP